MKTRPTFSAMLSFGSIAMLRAACWTFSLLLVIAPPVSAQQLDDSVVTRGPRFLLATAQRPVPVDISRTPVLRQRLSLDLNDVPLKAALTAIGEQSGLVLVYSDDILPPGARVRLRADGITVAAALTDVLADADVDVVFSRNGRAALVSRAKTTALDSGVVRGRVTDAKTGQAVPGTSVVLQGTRWKTTTDANGQYRIAEVPAGTYTITASRIGYAKQTQSVTFAAGQELTVDISLQVVATELEQIIVTGTLVPTERKAIPTPITVVTAPEIERSNVERVDQLFRGSIPGTLSYDLGPSDLQTSIYTRGNTTLQSTAASPGSNPKVYIDGVEVFNNTYLAEIDPASIDRVELVRGPQASTLYGSQALSGVLQIFTRKGELNQLQPQLNLRASYGSIESPWVNDRTPETDVTGSVRGGGQDFSYNVGASHLHTGAYVPLYNSDRTSFFSGFSGKVGPVRAEFSARYAQRRAHEPYYYWEQVLVAQGITAAKPYDTDDIHHMTTFGSNFTYTPSSRWQLNLRLGYDRFQRELIQSTPRRATPDDTLLSNYKTDGQKVSAAFNGSGTWQLSPAVSTNVVAGVDYWNSPWGYVGGSDNVNLGNLLGTVFAYARELDWNAGYFTQGQVAINDRVFLTAGVRIEQNPNFGAKYGWNGKAVVPRVGISFVRDIAGLNLKARASYGKALRPPTHEEAAGFTASYAVALPNPRLAPEAQIGGDVGMELYDGKHGSVEVTYYNQRVVDLIASVLLQSSNPPSTYQSQNLGEVKNTGWEVGARWSKGPIDLGGTFSITTSTVRSLSPGYSGELQAGDAMLFVPKHSGGLNLQYNHARGYLRAEMTYIGDVLGDDWIALFQYFYGAQPWRGSFRNYWITYPGFAKFHAGLGFDLTRELQGFIRLENLFNSHAVEQNNFFMPRGRSTTLGLRLKT